MAARGAESKEQISNAILATFEGSFKNGKEIRIPAYENGEEIQIKVTLTAAKVNVQNPNVQQTESVLSSPKYPSRAPAQAQDLAEPTEEEKENLASLLEAMF